MDAFSPLKQGAPIVKVILAHHYEGLECLCPFDEADKSDGDHNIGECNLKLRRAQPGANVGTKTKKAPTVFSVSA